MYVVKGETREGGGATVVTRRAREDALAAAMDFLDQGIPSVTIIGDSRTYTAAEFALTLVGRTQTATPDFSSR